VVIVLVLGGEQEAQGMWMPSIRAAAARITRPAWSAVGVTVPRRMEGIGRNCAPRYFTDRIRSGRVLSEEERAAENVYIQKMEREKLEKLRRKKADQEKADAAKSAKGNNEVTNQTNHLYGPRV
uniref:ATPase inhibitor n=1 Tax=Aegilops tauschii subsp. strangulata TaxID=200361 RepID=A0A452XI30_AEGTS